MDLSILNTFILIFILIAVVLLISFLFIGIQILTILRRILTKVEYYINNIKITQEEIKIKILDTLDNLIIRIRGGEKSGKEEK